MLYKLTCLHYQFMMIECISSKHKTTDIYTNITSVKSVIWISLSNRAYKGNISLAYNEAKQTCSQGRKPMQQDRWGSMILRGGGDRIEWGSPTIE